MTCLFSMPRVVVAPSSGANGSTILATGCHTSLASDLKIHNSFWSEKIRTTLPGVVSAKKLSVASNASKSTSPVVSSKGPIKKILFESLAAKRKYPSKYVPDDDSRNDAWLMVPNVLVLLL